MSNKERSAQARLEASQISFHRSLGLTDEEVDNMIQQFSSGDAESRKTWTRQLVEKYLSHVSKQLTLCCLICLALLCREG